MTTLIDRLPPAQQSVAAAQLLQLLMGTTEAIANDARIDEAKMLGQADSAVLIPAPDDPSDPDEGDVWVHARGRDSPGAVAQRSWSRLIHA